MLRLTGADLAGGGGRCDRGIGRSELWSKAATRRARRSKCNWRGVQVEVQRGNNDDVMVVLGVGESGLIVLLVVVVNQGDGAGDVGLAMDKNQA